MTDHLPTCPFRCHPDCRYFCGICWKVIGELREAAEAIIAEEEGAE